MAAFRPFFQAAFKNNSTGKMKTLAALRGSDLFDEVVREYSKKQMANNNLTEEEPHLYATKITTMLMIRMYTERNELSRSSISELQHPARLVRLKAMLLDINAGS